MADVKVIVLCLMCKQNFQLVPVPSDQYGCFYDGDSYLILAVCTSFVSLQLMHVVIFTPRMLRP